ncbi:hypothetical protein HZA73_03830 [candidate division TA06 bacterium]|nr:hypothetical protein [candidate division TA06 bacterium]
MKNIFLIVMLSALATTAIATDSMANPLFCDGYVFLGDSGHDGAIVYLYSCDWLYLNYNTSTYNSGCFQIHDYYITTAGYYNLCIRDSHGWDHVNFYFDGENVVHIGTTYLHTTTHPLHNYLQ